MAQALPECGYIYTIESNPEHLSIAKTNFSAFNLSNKITLLEGNALEKLNELWEKAPFDMMFIDADKGGYPKYLDWAELYIKQDRLVIADNTLLFNRVFLESPPKKVSKNHGWLWENLIVDYQTKKILRCIKPNWWRNDCSVKVNMS